MEGIGDRVRKAREMREMSQADLAKRVSELSGRTMTQQAIAALEANPNQRSLRINDIAQALQVRARWLETGKGKMEDDPSEGIAATNNLVEISGAEFARVPVFDVQLAAGQGAPNPYEGAEPLDYHYMSMSLLRSVTASPLEFIFGVQVKGDSMEDTLHDRDWAICDGRIRQLTREAIYGLNNDGEAIVKRVQQHMETRAVTLISDNPKYPPQIIKKPERLSVIGRVIFSIRRH